MPEWSVQRRFPRYPVRLPLLYKLKDAARVRAGMGWTRDLSEGGACLELADRLEPSSPLRLLLQTDQGSLEVPAEVIWSGKSGAAGEGVLHGVKFTQIPPDQHQSLRDLLLRKGQVRQVGVRLPREFAVTCQRQGTSDAPIQGRTGDVSRAGLLLRLPQVLPPGTVLEVSLPTGGGPLTAEGVIVWGDRAETQTPGDLIRHGLRFTDLSWSRSLALGLLLAETSPEPPSGEIEQ